MMMKKIALLLLVTAIAAHSAESGGLPQKEADAREVFVEKSRAALLSAGMSRQDLKGQVYWRGGNASRPPLVLLHGANDQAGTWAAVVPSLARNFRLIVPDLAGHGESEPRSGPITYAKMLEAVVAVIDREAPDGKVTLAGNSLGGWLAMLYALDHPDRVERLVLESASGMAWLIDVPLQPKTREDAVKALRAAHGPEAEIDDAMIDSFLSWKDSPMSRIGVPDAIGYLVDRRLSELTMPVTLVWGRHDGVLPVAYAEALHGKLPRSKLKVIEGAAHIPHRQQPEEFVRSLEE